MIKDDSPTPEASADGMDAGTPQADWSFEHVEKVVRMLYAHAPFHGKDKEGLKALVRQAFDFLDNLHAACEEVLGKRMERREMVAEASARAFAADRLLPAIVPFQQALRFITDEKNKDRAERKFDKVLRYDARRTHPWPRRYYVHRISQAWPSTALPKLPPEKKRRLNAQLKKWRKNGIPRHEVVRLRWLFEEEHRLVKSEQGRANRKKRGAKAPEVERRLQRPIVLMSELHKLKKKKAI
jgi:hypothetical protein